MSDKFRYTQVDNDGDHEDIYQRPARPQRRWISILSSFILGLITTAAATALYTACIAPRSHARHIPTTIDGSDPATGLPKAWSNGDCGNSPTEAQALGCSYSIVLHSWLPQSCLTQADLQDAQDMYHNRNWVYETASGRNLTVQQLYDGDYGHFTTSFDWHVAHCMYVWKRLHRVLLDPALELDSYTANYHHTSHCVDMIGGQPEGMRNSGTKIFVKYPTCAK